MAPFESIKKPKTEQLPSPGQEEVRKRAEFFDNASREEGRLLKEFMKSAKTRFSVAAFVAITSILGQGFFKDARAAGIGGGASSSAVDEISKRWLKEQEEISKKFKKEIESMDQRAEDVKKKHENVTEDTKKKFERITDDVAKKYEDIMEQIGKDMKDWTKKTPEEKERAMEEKYENWSAYSKAYISFREARFNSPEEMAAGFLTVIRVFPKFRGEVRAQEHIMNKDNFRKIVGVYMEKRNEEFPGRKIDFNRGVLELQIALQQSSGSQEQNYGFLLLRGGGIE